MAKNNIVNSCQNVRRVFGPKPRGSFFRVCLNFKTIVFLLLAAVVLFGIAGCAESESAPTTPTDGQPKSGGTLRIGLTPNTYTLDPAFMINTEDYLATQCAYDNLIMRQPDLTLKPMLATSWSPNADLTEWTLKLRPGVKFHHGKEFSAEDVVYTYKRVLDPATGSPGRAAIDFIKDVVQVDDLTVRFVLSEPNSFLPDAMTTVHMRIVPSDIDPATFATHASGTGPFILEEYLPGERTVFKRNDDYWEKGHPYLDEVILFYMPEAEARVEALKTGSIDVYFRVEATSTITLEDSPDVRIAEVASAAYLTIIMDTRVPPFNNKLVRQAIQAATDRDLIRQAALLGKGSIGNDHPIPSNDPAYWQGQEVGKYDPEKARALLEQAGYPDGLDITLHTSSAGQGIVEMAVAFKETAAPAGIRVDIIRDPEDIYWSKIWMVEPFVCSQWNGRQPDEALSISVKGDSPWNEAYFVSERIDELIVSARQEPDAEIRNEMYAEIQRILIDEAPRIIPVFRPTLVGHRQNVHGIQAHPNNWLILTDVWID